MHSEEHAVAAECLVRSLFHLHGKLAKKKGKQKVPLRNTQTFSLYLGKYAILMRLPDFEKILSFGNKDLAKRVTSMTRSVRWTAKHTYCYCYDIAAPFALSLTVYSLHFRNGRKTSAVCNIVWASRIFYFADAHILKWAYVDHHPTHCESSIPMHSEEHAVAAECLVRSLFHLHGKLTKKKGKRKVPLRNTQTFSLYLGKYAILMRLPDFEKILSFGNKYLAKRVTSMTRSVRWSAEKV